MWHITFFLVASVSVRFGIGSTIRTRQKIQCLPMQDFFFRDMILGHKMSTEMRLNMLENAKELQSFQIFAALLHVIVGTY